MRKHTTEEQSRNHTGMVMTKIAGEPARAILELQRLALTGKSFEFVDESVPGVPIVSVWVE